MKPAIHELPIPDTQFFYSQMTRVIINEAFKAINGSQSSLKYQAKAALAYPK